MNYILVCRNEGMLRSIQFEFRVCNKAAQSIRRRRRSKYIYSVPWVSTA